MCDKVVSKELIMLKYYPNRYKTQKMCEKAVHTCLSALKFVPDSNIMSKMFQIPDDVVFFIV